MVGVGGSMPSRNPGIGEGVGVGVGDVDDRARHPGQEMRDILSNGAGEYGITSMRLFSVEAAGRR